MKPKILIIEDETKYAYILEKFFNANDFEVVLAFDGLNGLQEFRRFNPDIIVLDIMLPKMDGYEIAKRIRRCHILKKINILALITYIYMVTQWAHTL